MKFFYIDSLGGINLLNFNNLIFRYSFNINLICQILNSYKSNLRLGKRKQKNRSEVNYSKKKLYKQKGTGRSRAGMASSPIRVGGGRAFPSKLCENFSHKINKKMYCLSLLVIFSYILLEGRVFIIEDFFLVKPKTIFIKKKFEFLNLKNNFVFLTSKINRNFFLSSRNLFNFNLINISKINPVYLIKFSKILITSSSLEYFEFKLLWIK